MHRRIALFVVQTIGSSRRRLVLGFMAASAFLSMWINNTATTLLMLPIVGAVLARADEEDGAGGADPRFAWCLLLGVAYASSVGGMGTPSARLRTRSSSASSRIDSPRALLTFGEWFVCFAPLPLLFVPLALAAADARRLPVHRSALRRGAAEAVAEERAALGPMSIPERRMATVFAATALLWVFRADVRLGSIVVPGWSRLLLGPEAADAAWYAQHKNDISDATVATLMAVLLFVLPSGARGADGAPPEEAGRRYLMDWRTAARLPWEVLLLLGGGFCLAQGFKVSGLDAVIGGTVGPLIEGLPAWSVVALVALFVSLLTEVTSNTATTAVLLPVMAAAAVQAGVDPLLVMLPATIAASAAFMMPVATPPNAVVFATRRIPVPKMARAGVLLNLLMVALITLVFEFWVRDRLGIGVEVPAWAR